MSRAVVPAWRLMSFASPALITYMAWMPLGYVIAKFYAKYTSLDLATIGLIIFLGRIFDAAIDPAVAYLSDRFDTRWGRRKPWLLISAPLFVTGFVMIVSPPQDIHWAYFLFANVILYTGWTLFEITHVAWGLEMDRAPASRARIAVLLKVCAYLGSLAFFAFPFLFNPEPGSTEFTPPVMTALGIAVAVAFPLLVLLAVTAAPREQKVGDQPFRIREVLSEMRANRRLLFYLCAFGLWALADGLIVGLFIVYVDAYHGLSAAEGLILLAAYLSRVVAAPLALALVRRFDLRRFWIFCALSNAGLYLTLFLIPAGEGAFLLLMIFAVLAGLIDCALGILALMLLGEVIDEDARRTRRDKAASCKAAVNLVEKALRALGMSGGLLIVGAAGLALGEENTGFALWTLLALLALGPALLNLGSAFGMSFLRFDPVTEDAESNAHVS